MVVCELPASQTSTVHVKTCQRNTANDLASLDPLNIVKDYVAGLIDRTLQRRLRDTHRNNTHRRVVTNDDKEKPLMIFETDDMVFVYNPEGRASCGMTGKISYWFAKTARLRAYAAKAQHLETNRETESATVSSTACAD